jgi:hypothetical protein
MGSIACACSLRECPSVTHVKNAQGSRCTSDYDKDGGAGWKPIRQNPLEHAALLTCPQCIAGLQATQAEAAEKMAE